MKAISKNEVSRDQLIAIFFFERQDAPFMVMGESWRIAANAINQDDDYDHGYFVGFHEIISTKMKEIPSVFNEILAEKIRNWGRKKYFDSKISNQKPFNLSKAKVYYTKYYDKDLNHTWGIAYLLKDN